MHEDEGIGGPVDRRANPAPGATAVGRRRLRILSGALCASLIALTCAGSAAAKVVVSSYTYDGTYPEGSFNGADAVGATAPFPNNLVGLDIDQVSGDVYVGNYNSDAIYKFNSAGESQPFSALGGETVIHRELSQWADVMVDNSGLSTQGNIFGWAEYGALGGYLPSGASIGGEFPKSIGTIGNGCGGDVAPNAYFWITDTVFDFGIRQYNPLGVGSTDGPAGGFVPAPFDCAVAIDSQGNFYGGERGNQSSRRVRKYSVAGVLQDESQANGLQHGVLDPYGEAGSASTEPQKIAVDRSTDHIFVDHQSYINEYDPSGSLINVIGKSEAGPEYPGLQTSRGLAINETTGVLYVVNNRSPRRVDTFVPGEEITIPDVTTEKPSGVTEEGATLEGHVDPAGGGEITDCHFEFGATPEYEYTNLIFEFFGFQALPCEQPTPIAGPTNVTASTEGGVLEELLGPLPKGVTFHFRATATSANGKQSNGADRTFQPSGPPIISDEAASEINTTGATISANVDPNGSFASYHFEYGETAAYGSVVPEPDAELPDNEGVQGISEALTGLQPNSEYHYRVVVTNGFGTEEGPDHAFTTFASPSGVDPCPNAQVRQQTGASLLLNCRAYELSSAQSTGGYDVQSELTPGQATLSPQPRAADRLLYSVHHGKIPGTGDPTNHGLDPYVATRGSSGWSTQYVGIPASGTPSTEPFGSPLAGANGGLSTFAFGGESLCDPCFADGSTGIPVHMPSGALVQGMKGSLDPGPAAEPSGYIGRALSADGTHLVFGSTSKFEPDGNSGEISIYNRNLTAGTTDVVSKTPAGATMTGPGIGGIDVSDDGSRALVGELVSTDAAGNDYWHLYMNVGGANQTVDVTPGTTTGVLYGGMTGDGTRVLFTTPDALGGGDTDESADVYRSDVGASSANLTKISTGNNDTCNPDEGPEGPHWNNVAGEATCDAVAFAGAAGVASSDGTIYFLSPEELGGAGTADGANLFVARPSGSPHFVATLEPSSPAVRNAVYDNATHRFSDFQVTPSGNVAVFASTRTLTSFDTRGRSQVYRYNAPGDALICASCANTGATPMSDTNLSSGLNLTDDGKVFFTSSDPLALRDTNGVKDAYQWENGVQELVSTGISPFPAQLLSVSADGVDAYFFTREVLVPQDENGNLMKVYDARADGGFLDIPPLPLCAAKDECQGPGTQPAPPPLIGSFEGQGGNAKEDCGRSGRKAKKESRRAKKLRRMEKRASSSRLKRSLRRRASKASRAAKRSSKKAKRCRRRNARRAG